jgi:hypothetical protein
MKNPLKMAALLMALMFAVQGCAVFVGDDHFRHRRFRHRGWHSSLEQSNQPMTQNQLAKNVIDQQQVDKGNKN